VPADALDAAVDPYGDVRPELITRSAQLDGCDGSYTRSANLNVREGTFVITGIVHGVRRAAEQRVVALVEEPPKATAIMALKMVEVLVSRRGDRSPHRPTTWATRAGIR